MFLRCSSLTSLDLSNFDTGNVTSMGYMFYGCSSLTSLGLSNFNTSNVTNMAYMFYGCSNLTNLDLSSFDTSNVTAIESMFLDCSSLELLTIGQSITDLPSFSSCEKLKEINSYIIDPYPIASDCFPECVKENAILNVYVGTRTLYETIDGWREFKNIMEKFIVPSDSNNTEYSNADINEETDLNGKTIGNIYYCISDENGSYSSVEGCLILKKGTSDEQMDEVVGMDLFGEDLKNNYTGIVFMVQAGNGTIVVNAETVGNMTLKVKIGNNAPIAMELEGKMKASFSYTVSEPTYVYIYGGETSTAHAKGMNKTKNSKDFLKIYGIGWGNQEMTTSVDTINETIQEKESAVYNLNGQRVQSIRKGIYIKNGKKYIVN